jgi:hypothetical protein
MEPKVFISYRREETAGHAGRVYDLMSSRFGDANVFMDVDLAPGVDFVKQITAAVSACHVLLVIIGPHWATLSRDGASPRIAEPGDFVRLELETGLQREDVTVIPVLVAGARMPAPEMLPNAIRALARRNALELSDSRWQYDMQRLLSTLETLLANTSAVQARPALPPQRRDPRGAGVGSLVLVTALLAAAAGAIGRGAAQQLTAEPEDDTQRLVDAVLSRGITWALIGAVVAVWLAIRLRAPQGWLSGLVVGAWTGALAGVAGAAVVALPRYLPDSRPPEETLDLLGVGRAALTGVLIGALIAWLWRQRTSVGILAGLLVAALIQAVVVAGGLEATTDSGRVVRSALDAALIVGFVAAVMATRSARAAGPSGAAAYGSPGSTTWST